MGESYDKAKYHFETVEQEGLPEEAASTHTVFYLAWLVNNDLVSDEVVAENETLLERIKTREGSPFELYEFWDHVLHPDMLSEDGNAFTSTYFDFEVGRYLADYEEVLASEIPSIFGVEFNWANYDKLAHCIDARYSAWRKPWWKFW